MSVLLCSVGKSVEEVRKLFHIQNDFTPEEEEAILAENKGGGRLRESYRQECISKASSNQYESGYYKAQLYTLSERKIKT